MLSGQLLVQTTLSGVLLGCLFGTMVLGLTLKWGFLAVADFSHISMVLFGAYMTYTLVVDVGLPVLLAVLALIPVFFLAGVGLQYSFQRFNVHGFKSLLVTFGLFIIFENVVTLIWSADTLTMRGALPDWLTDPVPLPPPLDIAFVLPADLIAAGVAVVMVGGTWWVLNRTATGRATHAMSQDPAMAQAFGVRLNRTALLLSGVAAASAAVAGGAIAIRTPLTPQLPLEWLGVVVVATLLGGLGSPLGGLVAAVALLVVQNIWSLYFQPSWAPLIAFSLLFVFLGLQPVLISLRARRQMST